MATPAREYAGRKVLVTGGAGCIGSNLVRTLADAGAASVVVLDDLSAAQAWNVANRPNVKFIRASVLDDQGLRQAFREKPDVVFHLAAHFANQNSVDHPETDLLVNGLGTLKVLQYAQLGAVQRFVYASSGCSVYGNQAPLPVAEDFMSLHLDTPYQVTKLLGELYANYFRNHFGLETVNLRFFNVYGPGEVPGRYRNVIPNFLWLAMHGKPLPITGTGQETRDFTFVGDIVDGLLAAGVRPEAVGQAINLASSTETAVGVLAEKINKLTRNKAGTVTLPRRDWDKITRRRASIKKAQKLLGYRPGTAIDDGLRRTYEWIREHRARLEEIAPV